jgi:cob(I)alamin adenosyltransferase
LFTAGAELATPPAASDKLDRRANRLTDTQIERLETAIDGLEEKLPQLTQFILPGGAPAAAALHLARTVCRRAERRVISLSRREPDGVSVELLVYLNRLGDLLFVMARAANAEAGAADVAWRK